MAVSSLLVNPYYASPNEHDIIAKSYTKTQTAFDNNTCTVKGKEIDSNCANITPLTIGEKNIIDVNNLQSSVINEQRGELRPPGPPGPPGPGTQNMVHVVWQESNEIFYKRSTDRGVTFEDSKNLSNNPGRSLTPAVAISGNNVYVVWYDDSSGAFDVVLTRSIDGGVTFDDEIMTLGANTDFFGSLPAITANGNNIFVIWADGSLGNTEIFYRSKVQRLLQVHQ